LPTSEIWRLEPHLDTVSEILQEVWLEEMEYYEKLGFEIEESRLPYLGKPECLGFDTRKIMVVWPARAKRDRYQLELGEMMADVVVPAGSDWYRAPDNVIFADNIIDAT